MKRFAAILSAMLLASSMADRAAASFAYAISAENQLIRFDIANPGGATTVGTFTGAATSIFGIDFRPGNGLLYGFGADAAGNQVIVTINTNDASTTFSSTPSVLSTSGILGVDFNPVPDRMRLVNDLDQNLRINVDNGVTISDTALFYKAGDPNFGADPEIVDAGYTNSFLPSPRTPPPSTQLYYIDSALDILVTTDNPNAGELTTVGALGVDTDIFTGFDILSVSPGTNLAYALLHGNSGAGFYSINLNSGAATLIGGVPGNLLFGLAVVVPEPSTLAMAGLPALLALVGWRRRRPAS